MESTPEASPSGTAPDAPAPEPGPATTSKSDARKWTAFERVSVCLQAVIALATVVYAIIATMQWSSMERALKSTNESLSLTREGLKLARASHEAADRAWVLYDGIDQFPIVADRVMPHRVVFTNFGRSPAKATVGVQWQVNPKFPEKPEYPSDVEHSVAIIGSQQGYPLPLPKFLIPQGALNAIQKQTTRLWIHGFVAYTDLFQRPRRTTFCLYYDVSTEPHGFAVCPTYNHFD